MDRFGENASITSGTFLSLSLWLMGFPDQAKKTSAATLLSARQAEHPNTLGFTLTAAATLNRWMRKGDATLALAEEAIAFSQEYGFPFWLAFGRMYRSWGLVLRGQAEEVVQIRQSAAAGRAIMNALSTMFLSTLAEALVHLNQHEAALSVANDALEAVEKIGDRHFEAELYRLKGESLLGLGNMNGAENCFHKALEISRKQGAKSLELRAAMSLARHFKQMEILSAVYTWFTEGFDTPDLIAASRLLE